MRFTPRKAAVGLAVVVSAGIGGAQLVGASGDAGTAGSGTGTSSGSGWARQVQAQQDPGTTTPDAAPGSGTAESGGDRSEGRRGCDKDGDGQPDQPGTGGEQQAPAAEIRL